MEAMPAPSGVARDWGTPSHAVLLPVLILGQALKSSSLAAPIVFARNQDAAQDTVLRAAVEPDSGG